jgi:hypothetical protein
MVKLSETHDAEEQTITASPPPNDHTTIGQTNNTENKNNLRRTGNRNPHIDNKTTKHIPKTDSNERNNTEPDGAGENINSGTGNGAAKLRTGNGATEILTGAADNATDGRVAEIPTAGGVTNTPTAGGQVPTAHPPPDIKFFQNVALRDWKRVRTTDAANPIPTAIQLYVYLRNLVNFTPPPILTY